MKKLKVFIVDDDSFCRNIYKQQLKNIGFSNIYTFTNGEECLSNMFIQPDIILLDYDMVTLDGLQILKIIKTAFPDITMLMISAKKEKQVALDAMEYGASAYISKDGKELETLALIAGCLLTGNKIDPIVIPEGIYPYKNFNQHSKHLYN